MLVTTLKRQLLPTTVQLFSVSCVTLDFMSDFDDRSGIVACETPWGRWWQTIDDVTVEVQVATGTRAKDVRCTIRPSSITLSVAGTTVFEVK